MHDEVGFPHYLVNEKKFKKRFKKYDHVSTEKSLYPVPIDNAKKGHCNPSCKTSSISAFPLEMIRFQNESQPECTF